MNTLNKKSIIILAALLALPLTLCQSAMAQEAATPPDSVYVCLTDGSFTGYAIAETDSIVFSTIQPLEPKGLKAVDLGLSVLWANMNVGATAPDDLGMWLAWGETWEKKVYNDSTYAYSDGEIPDEISGTKYDAAHVYLGGDWRMPTAEECRELLSKCYWEWYYNNGKPVAVVTGPNRSTIYLPVTGSREDGYLYDSLTRGQYWSSTLIRDGFYNQPLFINFTNSDGGHFGVSTKKKAYGFCVRAVCAKKSK